MDQTEQRLRESGWIEGTAELREDARAERRAVILDDAREAVTGDRQRFYGHPLDNHQNEADLWSAYLRRKYPGVDVGTLRLTARDVCLMMVLLKVSRDANLEKRDNLVDVIGYAENAEECRLEAGRRDDDGKS